MARVTLTEPAALTGFLAELHENAAETDWSTRHVARAFARQPQLLEDYLGFYYRWHRSDGVGELEPRLKELVRLRIATLNGCMTCKAARLDPSISQEEGDFGVDDPEHPFGPRERAAITFAEKMAVDHFSIDDRMIRELREHFSEAEVLELMMLTGQYIGFGRMLAILQLEEVACPIA
jgi:alkylhydroperoxidase family enzyme